jgi:hypothetical protein
VAKKTNVRPSRVTGPGTAEARRARQVRQAPRPTATVPIESAAVPVRPPVELPASRPAQTARPASPSRINRPGRTSSTLISDYSYVSRDLTRIASLAAVAFAVLVGLTFVIH